MISLTIDCEQWTGPLLRGIDVPENGNTDYSYLGNKVLLNLFKKHDLKSTFFITSYFAEKHPKQVNQILDQGHEVGSHGHSHYYRGNSRLDLRKDVELSKEIIEKITGEKLKGFRAPQMQFSLGLVKILKELGFEYDSSIHSACVPGFYNHRNKPLKPFNVNELIEKPANAMPYTRLPISWLWMRNFGNWWTKLGVNLLKQQKITPVLYFHSWEFYDLKNKFVPKYYLRKCGFRFEKQFDQFLKSIDDEFIPLCSL